MIYLIGGASRGGKSTLAEMILDEKSIPYFSIDSLREGIKNADPSVMEISDDDLRASDQLAPILEAMIENIRFAFPSYVLEGVNLRPSFIRRMMDIKNTERPLRGCVLGYPGKTTDHMVQALMSSESMVNDWLSGRPSDYQTTFFSNQLRITEKHLEESQQHDVPFIETGDDRSAGLKSAMEKLGL